MRFTSCKSARGKYFSKHCSSDCQSAPAMAGTASGRVGVDPSCLLSGPWRGGSQPSLLPSPIFTYPSPGPRAGTPPSMQAGSQSVCQVSARGGWALLFAPLLTRPSSHTSPPPQLLAPSQPRLRRFWPAGRPLPFVPPSCLGLLFSPFMLFLHCIRLEHP